MSRLLHYSSSPLPAKRQQWCEAESFRLDRLRCVAEIVLSADAPVLRLSRGADIDALTNEYEAPLYPGCRLRGFALDWRRIAKRYDRDYHRALSVVSSARWRRPVVLRLGLRFGLHLAAAGNRRGQADRRRGTCVSDDAVTLGQLREIAGGRLLLRQDETRAALGFTRGRLLEEVSSGRLRYVLIGKRRRFKPAELAAYLQRYRREVRPVESPIATPPFEINVRAIFGRARSGAKLRSKPFFIDYDDVERMAERADGRCEVSGVPFSAVRIRGAAPFAPSIDRIDSGQGYMPENCRLVCYAVNVALHVWGDEVLERIAHGIVGQYHAR